MAAEESAAHKFYLAKLMARRDRLNEELARVMADLKEAWERDPSERHEPCFPARANKEGGQ